MKTSKNQTKETKRSLYNLYTVKAIEGLEYAACLGDDEQIELANKANRLVDKNISVGLTDDEYNFLKVFLRKMIQDANFYRNEFREKNED